MTRIKNTSKILIKATPADTDLIVGSDMDNNGKTVNFYVGSVKGSSGVTSDNLPKKVNFGSALTGGIAAAINSIGTPVTVAENEIAFFVGIETPDSESDVAYNVVYVVNGKGAGTYGAGGSITVAEANLVNIKFDLITDTDLIDNDPNAVVFNIGEIGTDNLLTTLNTYAPAFTILQGQNAYFEFTRSGVRYLYGFSGVYGVYGNGQNQILLSELFLVFDGSVQPVVTKTSDITNDGSDSTSTYVEADELGAAAFSNSYSDLDDKPTIPTLTSELTNDGSDSTSTYVEADELGAVAFSNDYADLDNKPTIPSATTKTSDITNDGSDSTSTYVEADELGAVAFSNDYDNLDNKPAITLQYAIDNGFNVQSPDGFTYTDFKLNVDNNSWIDMTLYDSVGETYTYTSINTTNAYFLTEDFGAGTQGIVQSFATGFYLERKDGVNRTKVRAGTPIGNNTFYINAPVGTTGTNDFYMALSVNGTFADISGDIALTLQEVTEAGATTDVGFGVVNDSTAYIQATNVAVTNGFYAGTNGSLGVYTGTVSVDINTSSGVQVALTNSGGFTTTIEESATASRFLTLPNKTGIVAVVDDIAIVGIDEGNGVGYIINGRVAANYGNIGNGAVDFSFNGTASSTYGATGAYSIAAGGSTIASNSYSAAFGHLSTASGYAALVAGHFLNSPSYAETSVGIFNTVYTPVSLVAKDDLDRVFNVGNGNNGGDRHDALTVLKNGKVGIGIDNFEAATNAALLNVNGAVQSKVYTFGTLPTGALGMKAFISDGTSLTFSQPAVGGGAAKSPVYYDGTQWRVG